MPTVRLPNGRLLPGVPEGATQQQVMQMAVGVGLMDQSDADMLTPTGNFAENALAGFGRGMVNMGRGAQQAFHIGDQEALQQRIDEARVTDAPLMDTYGGEVGNFAGTVAPAILASAIPGANTYAGAAALGAIQGALNPTSGDESRLFNTALGAGAGIAGQYAGNKLAQYGQSRATAEATRMAQNVERDATLRAAQAEGFAVQPSEVNTGLVNNILEGTSGRIQTAAAISIKNQSTTDRLAREALGVAHDAPLTRGTVDKVRGRLGKVYESLANAGDYVPDASFMTALDDIAAQGAAAQKFKSLANPKVTELVDDFRTEVISGPQAVEAIKNLYSEAAGNLKSAVMDPGRKSLGLAQRKLAESLQDLMDRQLSAAGAGDMLKVFRAARRQYATAMSVRRAIKPGTGHVVASKLAQQLNSDVPLSGGLKTVAEFANAAPRSMAMPAYAPGLTALDVAGMIPGGALGTMAGGALGGGAGALAFPLARAGARGLLTSDLYQGSRMMQPGYGTMVPQLARIVQPALPGLTAQAAIEARRR